MNNTTQLIPVSQWVYDLFKVTYWSVEPEKDGYQMKTIHLAVASENHLKADADENIPEACTFMTWERVKENVGHPRIVGSIYGQPIYEDSWTHGKRLSEKL